MSEAARITDICDTHDGVPIPGSSNVYINNIGAVRVLDDLFDGDCGDSPINPENASSNVFINNKNACRKGDIIACGGSIVSGSPNVFIN